MKTQNTHISHEEVDGLLPWYVNGTLSPTERGAVEEHLADCIACAEEVRQLERIADAVQDEIPTPLITVPDGARLNELLDADTSSRSRRAPAYLAAAALAAAVFAGILILADSTNRVADPVLFETATATATAPGAEALTDYVFDIEFAAGVAAREHPALLESMGVRDAVTTSGSAAVRGIVSLPAASMTELQSIADSMAARDEIDSVRIVAVQLPVRAEP
ncbi:MAG: zf-HC2 domain-containing protein [Pseudomonadota bacterium]